MKYKILHENNIISVLLGFVKFFFSLYLVVMF